MDMDSESELFKISNCQYSFNELIVYIPIHGWQCKNLFGYRGEPLYELLLKWTYPSTFNPGSGVSRNGGTPEIIHFDRMLHCRPSSYWGTPGSRHCLHWDISRESLGPDRPHRCGSPSAKAVWTCVFCHGHQMFMGILRSRLQKNVYYSLSIYGFFLFGHVIIQTCVSSLVYHPYQLSLKKSGPQIRSPLDRGKVLGGPGSAWILGIKSMVFSSHHFPYVDAILETNHRQGPQGVKIKWENSWSTCSHLRNTHAHNLAFFLNITHGFL